MRITRHRLVGATVVAAAAAVLLPGSAAVALISPPLVLLAQPQSPATLVARGAAVDVPVEYTCTGTGMSINLTLTEKVGKKIASGYGWTNVSCDGATHRTLIRVTASGNGTAFAAGSAAAQADVSGCYVRKDRWICGSDSIVRTIKIKK
jgi:hypothetical protein